MSKIIVLLGPHSCCEAGRRWHAGQQRLEVVWEWPPHGSSRRRLQLELLHQTERNSILSSAQGYLGSTCKKKQNKKTQGCRLQRALSALFSSYTYRWWGTRSLVEISHISPASHPADLPSRQTCCRCRPEWRRRLFCQKGSYGMKCKRLVSDKPVKG